MVVEKHYGEIFKRYVPRVVLARYLNDESKLVEPEMQSYDAAVGFFDISGFSTLASELKMAEKEANELTKSGRIRKGSAYGCDGGQMRGMLLGNGQSKLCNEKLIATLNKTLGKGKGSSVCVSFFVAPVISVISEHGGDIVKVRYIC